MANNIIMINHVVIFKPPCSPVSQHTKMLVCVIPVTPVTPDWFYPSLVDLVYHDTNSDKPVENARANGAKLGHYTMNGTPADIEKLLEKGADPNHPQGESGSSPLCYGCYDPKNKNNVRVLLKAGANPNILPSEGGLTPLMIAVINRCHNTAKLLLEHGADVQAVSSEGETALDIATSRGNHEMCELICSYIPTLAYV